MIFSTLRFYYNNNETIRSSSELSLYDYALIYSHPRVSDVSGGDSASILDAMRRAMDVSQHLQLQGEADAAISWREAFYLATLGGAKGMVYTLLLGFNVLFSVSTTTNR